ncbi:MAG: YkgJ family cysteine cluster protein [Planctomycetota bacterium]
MESLPVVDCDGCGACCMHMGYPAYVLETAKHPAEENWLSLPADLKRELEKFIADYSSPAQGQLDGPCFWFDAETRRCKHHEHRPRVCRDFVVGCNQCLDWRKWLREQPGEST